MALRLERDGDVLKVTLARAERRNALTVAMLAELERVADGLAADAEVRAVVLMADGPDFSVGMDVGAMEAGAGGERPALGVLRRMARQGARTLRAWLEVDQPVVCAMRGVATGGGACLASVADLRVAAPDARLGYGEVRLGIPLMWNAIAPLLALTGPARAKRLVLTGALLGAETLARWGLVDEVADDPDAAALALARELAALPPVAVQMAKRSINALAHALGGAVLHADADQWLLATLTADHREALAAFREKRAGRFEGR